MRRKIQEKTRAMITRINLELEEEIVVATGFLTFFFGFGAGAILNFYLLAINHPLATEYRSILTYISAILGDGIILPIINMIAMAFFLKNREYLAVTTLRLALVAGLIVTLYFNIGQAINGVVNWAMPAPWHWNFIGLWHGIYMFCVASFLSLFYLVTIRVLVKEKELPRQVLFITLGLIIFFVLLRLDYISLDLTQFIPRL
ncbi:hypothetical protein HYS29_01290 [Candidatus Microgenomates bacterium]|nr:hypothetical protein [Candidatus Microgenomates bacterium]